MHTLALALGGRTVAEWRAVMTADEIAAWMAFYKREPFDDYARLFRPAALVAHSMSGHDMGDLLDWLERKPPPAGFSAADIATMKAMGMKPPRKD